MVKRTRKSPLQRPSPRRPSASKVSQRPRRRTLLGAASRQDSASIDALFDDFARNLARKIAGSGQSAAIKAKDGGS
jgi:hypothetical protein